MFFLLIAMKFVGKCLLIEISGKKILAVGDLHLGYEEALNRGGVFVSRKMYEEMIEEFDEVFERVGEVDEIVLLGDVKHVFGKILRQEWDDVLNLFDYFLKRSAKIVVVKGNHDKIIGPIVSKRERVEVKDFYIVKEFCFLHGDRDFEESCGKAIRCWIAGHGHPAVKLKEGLKVEKYKCFLVGRYCGREVVLMPSFFAYSEGSDPRENNLRYPWKFSLGKFDVKIVSEGLKVLDFGKLGKL